MHALGSKIFMQIVHGSSHSQGYPDSARILGPSALVHPTSGLTPQEMTKDDIRRRWSSLFADAAVRVKRLGLTACRSIVPTATCSPISLSHLQPAYR